MRPSCAGLSLLELVIALALGVFIITAATTVLFGAQRSLYAQSAMQELQQNAHLSFELLARDIRQINLNMPSRQQVNSRSLGSGIIFSQANLPQSITQNITALSTQQELNEAATVQKSDQLLIQYLPEYQPVDKATTGAKKDLRTTIAAGTKLHAGVDCEGRQIEFVAESVDASRVIVNRYYLAKDPQQSTTEAVSYSLYCESGWYRPGDRIINGLNGGGQQLVKAVEAFKIRFGVQAPDGQLAYMGVNQYKQLIANADVQQPYNIVSIEVGLLIRASSSMASSNPTKQVPTTYLLAGQQLRLDRTKLGQQNDLRHSISQVIALRNAQGAYSYE